MSGGGAERENRQAADAMQSPTQGWISESRVRHLMDGATQAPRNCYFLYGCHRYNNKCAETGNK